MVSVGVICYVTCVKQIPLDVTKGKFKLNSFICPGKHRNTNICTHIYMEKMKGNVLKLEMFKVEAHAARAGKETFIPSFQSTQTVLFTTEQSQLGL